MDALIHQTAAVLRPGAAPGRLGVVFFATAPQNVSRAVQHSAETAFFHSGTNLLHRLIETVLMTDAELHIFFFGL